MLSSSEQANIRTEVDYFNKTLPSSTKNTGTNLGKDDFLKILITQLQNQDPTAPVEDKEFIAQMAQFSTLEQMTEMSDSFTSLSNSFGMSQALTMLGRQVEIVDGETIISGIVDGVQGNPSTQVMVQGRYYELDQVQAVYGH